MSDVRYEHVVQEKVFLKTWDLWDLWDTSRKSGHGFVGMDDLERLQWVFCMSMIVNDVQKILSFVANMGGLDISKKLPRNFQETSNQSKFPSNF